MNNEWQPIGVAPVTNVWFIGGLFFCELKNGKIIAPKNILKDDQAIIKFLIEEIANKPKNKPVGFFGSLRYLLTGRIA